MRGRTSSRREICPADKPLLVAALSLEYHWYLLNWFTCGCRYFISC